FSNRFRPPLSFIERRRGDIYPDMEGLDKQKAKYPRSCNAHKHGSNWPIFGLAISQTKEFLEQCKRLRKGFLASDELADIKAHRSSNTLRAELAALRPSTRSAV
ncbi:hypothetical protein, partial [Cupriavidus sp. AcVe19-6a]|uniref:hypothetical protein n=1 Tax=Cupriavidus sp. AcVe19-6a TaxID=2821358 RepID=UPI001AE0ED20